MGKAKTIWVPILVIIAFFFIYRGQMITPDYPSGGCHSGICTEPMSLSTLYGGYSLGPHEPFAFGDWWDVIPVLSLLFVLSVYYGLSSRTDSAIVHVLGLCGFMFLWISTLIAVFGLDFTFNQNYSYFQYEYYHLENQAFSLQLRYEWVLESIAYFIAGGVLVWIAERKLKVKDRTRSILPAIIYPLFALLVLVIALIIPFHLFVTVAPQSGWLVELGLLITMAAVYQKLYFEVDPNANLGIFKITKLCAIAYFIFSAFLIVSAFTTPGISKEGLFLFAGIMALVGFILFRIGKGKKLAASTTVETAKVIPP